MIRQPTRSPADIALGVKSAARELGFGLVGIAPPDPSRYRDYLRQWLDMGQAGDMHYLAERFAERTDPNQYLPGVRSIICVAINYNNTPAPSTPPAGHGRIARYALGDDYHTLLKPRLYKLADLLREFAPDAQTRCAVDTAPVMEKELAARAGIGWLGKNTCIIHESLGSWVLLGEILTTLELPFDQPALDRCGTCRRCIDACPTQAITEPYKLDATRCISYLTIEHRGPMPAGIPLEHWLYGCDICQEVCPWNRRAPLTDELAFRSRFADGSVALSHISAWTDEDYCAKLKDSPMKRVKLPILKRNAAIIAQAEAD